MYIFIFVCSTQNAVGSTVLESFSLFTITNSEELPKVFGGNFFFVYASCRV